MPTSTRPPRVRSPSSITKANADCDSISGTTVTYDGNAHGASGDCFGVDGTTVLAGLDLGASFTDVPGGTADWTFTDVTGNYNDTSGSVAIVITKANADCDSISGTTVTYDGNAHGASGDCFGVDGTTVLAGLDLGASFTDVPGGTADWTFTDVTGNYNDTSGSVAIVITKANADCDSISGTTVTYDGNAHGASGDCFGVDGTTVLAGLDLGASFTDVPGGTADWTFTDVTGNYNDTSGSVAIVITKANADCDSISGTTVTYDGNAHGASGDCFGVDGTTVLAGLDLGASFTDVPGGTADWTFTDVTGNYNDTSGSVAIVITKANADCDSISGTTVTYDGNAHGASGDCFGVDGTTVLAGLDLGASFTDVPGGTADWTFTDVTGNYNDTSGSVAIVITKANADCDSISGTTVTYDGNAHGASGDCFGVDGTTVLAGLDLGASFTDVPGGTADWTFTDVTGNYNDTSGSVAIVITKADADCDSISGTTVTYDGNAHGASGDCFGVDGTTVLAGLDLGASFTDVPGGTADWTFTDVTGNYNDTSGSVAIVITKANADCDSISGTTVTYDGNAHGASGDCFGVDGTTVLAGLDLGASFTDVPGGTADWTFTDVTGNYNDTSGSVAIVIEQKDVIGAFTAADKVWDGNTSATVVARTVVEAIVDDDVELTGGTATFASSMVGTWTVTLVGASLTGTDAGNYNLTSVGTTTATITTAFRIIGFDSPVDMTVVGDPRIWNSVKNGQTVPLKFRVFNLDGTEVTSITGLSAMARNINCSSGVVEPDLIPIVSTAETGLRRTGDRFHFNWAVPKTAGKCYQVLVKTVDGSTTMVASMSGTPVQEAYFKSK